MTSKADKVQLETEPVDHDNKPSHQISVVPYSPDNSSIVNTTVK